VISELIGSPRGLAYQRFLQALLLDFDAHGREAIEECRKQSPLGYVKVLGHLIPREMKVQLSQSLKSMSDEELDDDTQSWGSRKCFENWRLQPYSLLPSLRLCRMPPHRIRWEAQSLAVLPGQS
jgi:hypothetical protein